MDKVVRYEIKAVYEDGTSETRTYPAADFHTFDYHVPNGRTITFKTWEQFYGDADAAKRRQDEQYEADMRRINCPG